MRSLVGLYLMVGVVLLAIGLVSGSPCPYMARDLVRDAVFVIGWPVYLYNNVAHGHLSLWDWLYVRACGAGIIT
jgi:hypothetical protein